MGPDPILTGIPIAVPIGMVACLLALTITAWPILAGERVTDRRRRQAVWGSWACLVATPLALAAELTPGLYGFLTLSVIAMLAATTLWRSRSHPA